MNKKIYSFILLMLVTILVLEIVFVFNKETNTDNTSILEKNEVKRMEEDINTVTIHVNDEILKVELENNSSAIAFMEKLKQGDITIQAQDYSNFEKVGDLGFHLPTNDTNIIAQAGDLILYQGDKIVLYYDTNTWNFTKIGKVQNKTQEELKSLLGDGDVTLVFSLNNAKEIMFNFETKTVKLNSGYDMPLNGIGTYSLTGDVCYNSIISALDSGVRLIDTAYMYQNEEEIGKAMKDSNIPREEIFITTKIYPSQFNNPEEAIERAFEKLDVEYIDLMLLHHPGENDLKAYQTMEKYVESGKIRSIGLSNWYVEELEQFLPQITVMPALVQNEIHPYYQENDVIPYIQSKGIVVQGWYPFGGRGHTKLRWNLQKGVIVIPGSSNPAHIKENTEIYHFELTDEEMDQINKLDRNEKHDWC